jgi:hypothetical protein
VIVVKIPEKMRRELEGQFSLEQIEEGLKRLEGVIRVRDRGEDCQTVLNEPGIALCVHSYRKYKGKLDLYGIRGLIPKKVPRWNFTLEVQAYANGVATGKTAGLSARQ